MQIKIKFRLATVLSQHLRDFKQANSILKHLRKYCNTYQKLDMSKEASALHEKQGELVNNRDKGTFKVKDIVMKYQPERPLDILTQVADYVNDKLEIRFIEGRGRGFFAKSKIAKGDLLIVNQAMAI